MLQNKDIARIYFKAWNLQDLEQLSELFTNDVTLIDWDQNVVGKVEVITATREIFEKFPAIEIEIIDLYDAGKVIIAELRILLNSEASLRVIDLITISNGKILKIDAFKQ